MSRGDTPPALNWIFILLPGAAFVPAAYFAVKLHVTKDQEQLRAMWPKTLVYGGAGLVLLIGGAFALSQGAGGAA